MLLYLVPWSKHHRCGLQVCSTETPVTYRPRWTIVTVQVGAVAVVVPPGAMEPLCTIKGGGLVLVPVVRGEGLAVRCARFSLEKLVGTAH